MERKDSIVYKNGEIIIKNTYVMLTKDKIGSGSFGEIYRGYNSKTKEKLAFKLELNTSKTPQLAQEYKVLKALQGISIHLILLIVQLASLIFTITPALMKIPFSSWTF